MVLVEAKNIKHVPLCDKRLRCAIDEDTWMIVSISYLESSFVEREEMGESRDGNVR